MKSLIKYIVLVLITSVITFGQGKDYLKSLQAKFNTVTDLSADMVQYTNGQKNLEGKFLYKKENHLRIELRNFLVVTDGKTNWNYNKKQKKVIISNYDENDPSAISLKKIIFDYPSKCTVTETSESGVPVIELKPGANSGINAQLIKIWTNNKNLVKKVLIKSNTGSDIEFRFSNYKINSGLPESEFSFNPPEGIKVIDLR